jgi:hypothetical protein
MESHSKSFKTFNSFNRYAPFKPPLSSPASAGG